MAIELRRLGLDVIKRHASLSTMVGEHFADLLVASAVIVICVICVRLRPTAYIQ